MNARGFWSTERYEIKVRGSWKKQQELETERLASLAETTKENEIEGDDNMERPTNRQRLM